MRLTLATLAIAALLAVAAPFALQIAEGDKPTLSPDQETEYLRETADGRTAAHAVAETREKRNPAYIKLKLQPSAGSRTRGDGTARKF